MSAETSRAAMWSVLAAAFVAGFGVYWVGPAKILQAVAPGPTFQGLPVKVSGGSGRLVVEGGAATRAGAAVVRVEAPNLVYRQTCRDTCDELTIDYDAPPQAGAAVSVSGADGRAVFSGGTYDDAGQTHRLSAGADGLLRMSRVAD
ncbi:MAG: hypothetical protein ACREEO_03255 [Phenylobacterium sp.]